MTASEYKKKYVKSDFQAVVNFILLACAFLGPYIVIVALDVTGDRVNNTLLSGVIGGLLALLCWKALPDPDPNKQRAKEIRACLQGIASLEPMIRDEKSMLFLLECQRISGESNLDNKIQAQTAVVEGLVSRKKLLQEKLHTLQEEERERKELQNQEITRFVDGNSETDSHKIVVEETEKHI